MEDQWHNRLHLAALENGIIGNFFSIMWKSLLAAVVSLTKLIARKFKHVLLCTTMSSHKANQNHRINSHWWDASRSHDVVMQAKKSFKNRK